MSKFKKAEKKKSKLRLGITGPSGSGKTYSALRLAKGLGGRTAFIDTEKGSASLYADNFDFDVLELSPPYSPERYIEAMYEAVKAGYDIVIMDSISHAWAGQGGLLNRKEQLDARGGNSFQNWAKMTPIQERFISELINCPAHLIVTMRSKQEYIVEQNDKGKQAPRKVGLAPIQRDGFEYELTTVFDIAINHEAETSKDRTGLFVDKLFQVTEATGETLRDWLNSGLDLQIEPTPIEPVISVHEVERMKSPEKELSHIVYIDTLAGPTSKDYARMNKIKEELSNVKIPAQSVELTGATVEKQTEQEPNIKEEKKVKPRNMALSVYEIKVGPLCKYPNLGKIPEVEAKKWLSMIEAWRAKPTTTIPKEVEEAVTNIKDFFGIE